LSELTTPFAIAKYPTETRISLNNPLTLASGLIQTSLREVGLTIGVPIGLALVAFLLIELGVLTDVFPILLIGVILAASQGGGRTGFIAALISFVLLDFFLVHPRFTLRLVSPDDYIPLIIFLLVAVTTSHFAGEARDKGQRAIDKARQLEALFEAACQALGSKDSHIVLEIVLQTAKGILPLDWQIADDSNKPPQRSDDASLDDPVFIVTRSKSGSIGTIWVEIRAPKFIKFIHAPNPKVISPSTHRSLAMLAKLAENALSRIQLQLDLEDAKVSEAAESLRATIINSVAHDFRTPLSSIIASAATLEDLHSSLASEDRVDLARSIRIGAERLSRFTSKLLTAAQIDSGPVSVQMQWVDIHDLFSGVLDTFEPPNHRTGIFWDGSGADMEVYCDPVLLDQALHNIIENCLDYSPPGQPVRLAVLAGSQFRIQISDCGPGIPLDLREQMFRRWTRAEQPSKSRTGLGLGLSIARGFIQAIGGTVIATEKPDATPGACFLIELPMSLVKYRNATA